MLLLRTTIRVMAVGLLILSGCDRSARPEADRSGPRLVSISPAVTDLLVRMDLGSSLVGVSSYCRWPKGAPGRKPPVVGNVTGMNYEALLRVSPTVVLMQIDPQRIPQRLRDLARRENFSVLSIQLETLADLERVTRELATLCSRAAAAEDLLARVSAGLDEVRRKVQGRPRPAVLFAISTNPTIIAGRGTFIDELIRTAGGRNVAARVGTGYIRVDKEAILHLKPDVVIEALACAPNPGIEHKATAYWSSLTTLPAVKTDRVHILFDPTMTIPGATVARSARRLTQLIHP